MTAAEFAARLRGARRTPRGWEARCPSHPDDNASLSVWDAEDGWVAINCFAGCERDAILKATGVTLVDIGPPQATNPGNAKRQRGRIVLSTSRFEIRDVGGELRALHHRRDFSDGTKAFSWRRPDGKAGLNGIPATSLPLYRSETLAEVPDSFVVVVEGERAADDVAQALVGGAIGVVATVTGASTCPSDEVLSLLTGRRVVLWPDNDEPGNAHMAKVAQALGRVGAPEVRVVDWPDAPAHGDAVDYLQRHGSADLLELLNSAAPWDVGSRGEGTDPEPRRELPWQTAAELAANVAAEVEWAWQDYFPLGAVVELDGKVKVGKSTFLGHVLSAILDGRDFLGRPTSKNAVVYLTEEGPVSFARLLRRCHLDGRTDLNVISKRRVPWLTWEELVAAARDKMIVTGARVLVVDTLGKLVGFQDSDENSAGKAMVAMSPIQSLVTDLNALAIVSRHERKSGGDIGDSARGSSQLAGDADIVLRLSKVGRAGGSERRVLAAVGRFDETPEELTIQLDSDGYRLVGADDARDRAAAALLELVPTDKTMAVVDLLPVLLGLGHGRTMVYAAIKHLSRAGELVKYDGRGPTGHKRTLISRPVVQMDDGGVGRSRLRLDPSSNGVTLKTAAEAVSIRPNAHPLRAFGRMDGPTDEPDNRHASKGCLDDLDEVPVELPVNPESMPGVREL